MLIFLRRLMARTNKKMTRRAIDAAMTFTVAYFISFTSVLFSSCTPLEASWKSVDLMYPDKYKCSNRRWSDISVGVVSIISDTYALIIPEIMISRLKMERRQKVILYLVFGSSAM